MEQLRKDVKTILSDQCDNFRVEDGENPQSLKVFVENDKVESIDGLFKLAFPANVHIEVLPINEESEVKNNDTSPLEDIAGMFGIPMTRKGDDGKPSYLTKLVIGHVACEGKYSSKKPDKTSMLLDLLKSMSSDVGSGKDIEVRGSGKLPEGLKDLMESLGMEDGEPTHGCDCTRCEMLREALKVPGNDQVH